MALTDDRRAPTRAPSPPICAARRRAQTVREIRVHRARSGAVSALFDFSPEEIDGDPAVAAGRVLGGAVQPAGRARRRAAAGARPVLGQVGCSTCVVHLPLVLPPVVTGYVLLLLFGRQRAARAAARRRSRHRLRVPLDRRGAGLRGDGVSADGALDPAVARRGRPPARGRRRHARRQPRSGCS